MGFRSRDFRPLVFRKIFPGCAQAGVILATAGKHCLFHASLCNRPTGNGFVGSRNVAGNRYMLKDTRKSPILILCAAFLGFIPAAGFSHSLPSPVRQALKQAHIPESAVGVYVHEIGVAHPLLSINASKPMNPASVMKLVTTFAGLELLGPAYTWKTELYADGVMQDT